MILINLLPIQKIKQRLRLRYEAFTFIGSLLILSLVLVGTTLFMIVKVSALTSESKNLEIQKSAYLAIQREITVLQKNQEALEARITAINQLQTYTQLKVRILDEISNRTPSQRLWLSSLHLDNNNIAHITGIGMDNPSVAQYMQSLEDSPFLANANLISSTQTEIEGQKLMSFVLQIGFALPNVSQ